MPLALPAPRCGITPASQEAYPDVCAAHRHPKLQARSNRACLRQRRTMVRGRRGASAEGEGAGGEAPARPLRPGDSPRGSRIRFIGG